MITYKRYELRAVGGWDSVKDEIIHKYDMVQWSSLDVALNKWGIIKWQMLANRQYADLQLVEVEYEAFDDGDDEIISEKLIAERDTSRVTQGGFITEIN